MAVVVEFRPENIVFIRVSDAPGKTVEAKMSVGESDLLVTSPILPQLRFVADSEAPGTWEWATDSGKKYKMKKVSPEEANAALDSKYKFSPQGERNRFRILQEVVFRFKLENGRLPASMEEMQQK